MASKLIVFLSCWYNLFVCLNSTKPLKNNHYDFVIVGAGTAGTVLAARLSENPSWRILLIEAGNVNFAGNRHPAIATRYQGGRMDWHYATEPQQHCCQGLKDQKVYWPAGEGTSEINYMVYTRGNKGDYDRWAANGPGWSYEEVLPYFLKSEKYEFSKFNRKYHNAEGVMSIEYPYTTLVTDAFLDGANEMGFDIHDYNGKTQMRFSKVKAHMHRGQRHGVYQAFLGPVYNDRNNLTIVSSAQVTKILIDPVTKRAAGVVYIKNKRPKMAWSKNAVILSAGVVGSTKILLLSGIGPKEDLEKMDIPVIESLMVGQGIRDHISYFGLNYLTSLSNEIGNPIGIFSCSRCGKGISSSPAGIEAVGFVKLNDTNRESDVPDVEILLVNRLINRDLKILTNVEDDTYHKCFEMVEEHVGANIFPILLHPKSKGYIKLRSKNFTEPPIIQPNYLSEREDKERLVAGIRFVENLMKTEPFAKADAALYPVPVCDQHPIYSEEYWQCAIETLTMSFNDYMGGCKMGGRHDEEAVVDNELQVYGVEKLMVVDASVIPVTISGHTGAATIMIAEKAADIIKRKYGDRS